MGRSHKGRWGVSVYDSIEDAKTRRTVGQAKSRSRKDRLSKKAPEQKARRGPPDGSKAQSEA